MPQNLLGRSKPPAGQDVFFPPISFSVCVCYILCLLLLHLLQFFFLFFIFLFIKKKSNISPFCLFESNKERKIIIIIISVADVKVWANIDIQCLYKKEIRGSVSSFCAGRRWIATDSQSGGVRRYTGAPPSRARVCTVAPQMDQKKRKRKTTILYKGHPQKPRSCSQVQRSGECKGRRK